MNKCLELEFHFSSWEWHQLFQCLQNFVLMVPLSELTLCLSFSLSPGRQPLYIAWHGWLTSFILTSSMRRQLDDYVTVILEGEKNQCQRVAKDKHYQTRVGKKTKKMDFLRNIHSFFSISKQIKKEQQNFFHFILFLSLFLLFPLRDSGI